MIEIKEGRYFSHFWFVGDGQTGDWMACLWREDTPGSEWNLQYRFRYYADSKAFDSEDTKSWYSATAPFDAGEDKLVRAAELMAHVCGLKYNRRVEKLKLCTSDIGVIMKKVKTMKWMHMKEQPS